MNTMTNHAGKSVKMLPEEHWNHPDYIAKRSITLSTEERKSIFYPSCLLPDQVMFTLRWTGSTPLPFFFDTVMQSQNHNDVVNPINFSQTQYKIPSLKTLCMTIIGKIEDLRITVELARCLIDTTDAKQHILNRYEQSLNKIYDSKNYSLAQLKQIAMDYCLPKSGSKTMVARRIRRYKKRTLSFHRYHWNLFRGLFSSEQQCIGYQHLKKNSQYWRVRCELCSNWATTEVNITPTSILITVNISDVSNGKSFFCNRCLHNFCVIFGRVLETMNKQIQENKYEDIVVDILRYIRHLEGIYDDTEYAFIPIGHSKKTQMNISSQKFCLDNDNAIEYGGRSFECGCLSFKSISVVPGMHYHYDEQKRKSADLMIDCLKTSVPQEEDVIPTKKKRKHNGII